MIKNFLGGLLMAIPEAIKNLSRPDKVMLEKRGCDDFGCGHYLASRGERKHEGEDFKVLPGRTVRAFRSGVVTKLGWVYRGNSHFRYVQISHDGVDMQYMYLSPTVKVGDVIAAGDVIGIAQDISSYHSTKERTMINHIHYQVKVGGVIQNPNNFT